MGDHAADTFDVQEREALDEIFGLLLGVDEPGRAADLTCYIDGMLSPEYSLGPRVVEFDEEQHFSPFRLATLSVVRRAVEVAYDLDSYRRYCREPLYVELFLKNHRLRGLDSSEFSSPRKLVDELSRHQDDLKRNGYVNPKRRFPFMGGRIAQRAYYDCLRDFFHASRHGKSMGLKPIIRVSIYQIEELIGGPMNRAEPRAVTEAVRSIVERACGLP